MYSESCRVELSPLSAPEHVWLQLPVKDLPFSIAYIPTEPLLDLTRRLVPPVGGVDVAPVIWLAFFSFINEILLGQQGLLVLISQQQI